VVQSYLIDALEERCREAEKVMQQVFQRFKENTIWLSFSGGKDSTVLLDIASKVFDRFRVVYVTIPANTHEECDKYVLEVTQRYDCELFIVRRDDTDFWSLFQRYGYPCRNRWCLGQFKDKVIAKVTKGCGVGLIGVRRYESQKRMHRYNSFVFTPTKTNGYRWVRIVVAPLLNWTSTDIEAYIKRERIPINPLYEKVGWSCNCVFCPFLSAEKVRRFLSSELLAPFREKWWHSHRNLKQRGCETVWRKWDKVREKAESNRHLRYRIYLINHITL